MQGACEHLVRDIAGEPIHFLEGRIDLGDCERRRRMFGVPWAMERRLCEVVRECPTLAMNLDIPVGRRWAELPESSVGLGRVLLNSVMANIPRSLRPLADIVRMATGGRFHEQAQAVADRFGVSWRDVVLAAVSYDLTIATIGCSTLALASADGPILARNLDWWPEDVLARTSVRIDYTSRCVTKYITAGWPGSLGVVTGMAPGRFAFAINAVASPDERVSLRGYPVLLHLRRVLEDAKDFEAALESFVETRLAAPCLLTLVGVENHQRVVVERTPSRHALRRPPGPQAPLYATNDYHELCPTSGGLDPRLIGTSCSRFDALTMLLAQVDPSKSLDNDCLLAILSHPAVIQVITAQHVIARPATGELRVWVPTRLLADEGHSGQV